MRARPELAWWDVLAVAVIALAIAAAWFVGLATNLVNLLALVYLPYALATRLWALRTKALVTAFLRRPFAREHRWYLAQWLLRVAFAAVWLLVLRLTIVPLSFPEDVGWLTTMLVGVFVAVALLPLVPKRRVLAARLLLVLASTVFFAVQLLMEALPVPASELMVMDLPLAGETLAVQAGRSPLSNHHFPILSQRHALDVVTVKDGRLVERDPRDLAAHASFGEEIRAPLDGVVVKVVGDRPDVAIGTTDGVAIAGNHVVLQVAPERYVLFAHLKQGSVRVGEGERVTCGAVLAQVGNSGNTSAPHLHLQVQDRPSLADPGVRTFPIAFRNVGPSGPAPLRRNDRVRPDRSACR